jgi:hypothetical protein
MNRTPAAPAAPPVKGGPVKGGNPLAGLKQRPALLAGIAGAGVVLFVALRGGHGGGSSSATDPTVPAASSGGVYDSTANDVYNSLAGQLQTLQAQIDGLGSTSDPAAVLPAPAPTSSGKTTPRPVVHKPKPKPKPRPKKRAPVRRKPAPASPAHQATIGHHTSHPAALPVRHPAHRVSMPKGRRIGTPGRIRTPRLPRFGGPAAPASGHM